MNMKISQLNRNAIRLYGIAYLIPLLILFCITPFSGGLLTVSGNFLIPLSSVTFLFFLLHTSFCKPASDFLSLSFSMAYALTGFCLINSSTVSSLLCCLLLPLLFLALDKLLNEDRFLPITLLFTLVLYIEPIIGCILLLYLLAFILLIPECTIGKRIADFLHLLILFLFALGISAAFSLPQLHEFFTSVSENAYEGFSINYPWSNLLARFLPCSVLSFSFSSGRGMDLYCGLLAFIGLILYFFHNQIPFSKRMRTLAFTLLILLTLQTSPFQYLIELCSVNDTSYLYYSFFFVFWMLFLAYQSIESLREYKAKNLILGLVVTFLLVLTALLGSMHNYTGAALILIGLFLIFYFLLLPLVRSKNTPLLQKIFCLLLPAELIVNAFFCTNPGLVPETLALEDQFVLFSSSEDEDSAEQETTASDEDTYQSFYDSHIASNVYGTLNSVNTYVDFTAEENEAYNPYGLLTYLEEFNLKCRKLGIDSDILETAEVTISFDSSELYEITDETNGIFNFHSYPAALSNGNLTVSYTIEFPAAGTYLVYNNADGTLMRFDITSASLTDKGYLIFAPSENVLFNFQLITYTFDEEAFQTIPDLLVTYISGHTSFSSARYTLYFALTCISVLLLLTLTVNRHKKRIFDKFIVCKETIIHLSVYAKIINWCHKNFVYLTAFAVPFLLYLVSMILFSCEPFGDSTFLDEDGYPSVLAGILGNCYALKSGDITLSMLIGYSTNIYSLSSLFYAALLLPFSASAIPNVLLLSEAILFGLCGCSVVYYLTHRLNGPKAYKEDYRLLVPAFLYSVNAYMLSMHSYAYSWYLLFFFLPLLILALERLLYQKKWFAYTMLLAFSIFTNTNIALYLCIFLVIWFFTCRFTGLGDFIKKGLRFAVFSLLAALCAICNIATIFFGVSESGYSAKDSVFPSAGLHGSFLEQWKKLMIFTPTGAVNSDDGGINLYMSLLCLILLVAFLTCRRIRLRRKLTFALPAVFLLLSFNGQILSYLWNGLHYQSSVPNRYVFLLMFLCSIMAFDTLLVLRRQSILKMALVCLSILGFLTLCQFAGEGNALFCYLCSVGLIILYLIIHILFTRRARLKRFYYPAIVFLLTIEFSANWFYTCSTFGTDTAIFYGDYEAQSETNTALLSDTESFSRFSIPASCCMNNGNFTATPGSAAFISTLSVYQQALNSLCGNCGGSNYIISNYDSTPWGQSIAANRYLAIPIYATQALRDLSEYEYIGYANQHYLFENTSALHLGFYVPADLPLEMNTSALPDFMSVFCSYYTESKAVLMTPITLGVNTGEDNSVTLLNSDFEQIDASEANDILAAETASQSLSPANFNLYLRITFTPSKSGQVYLGLNEFVSLGYYEAGESASITIPYPNRTPEILDEYTIYTFDDTVYQEFIAEVSENQLENISIDDNVITAETNYEEDGYTMFSLPYDENWKAYVDGEEVTVENPFNSAVFISTPAGEHEITLVYDVTTYRIFTWISIGATLIVVLVYLLRRRRLA